MSKLVRIAPFNPRQGFVKQRHTIIKPRPMRFIEAQGWYEVDDEIAAVLAKVPQEERKPAGLRAFLVANDAAHAKQLEAEIRNASRRHDEEVVGTIDTPIRAARPGTKATASARGQAPAPSGRTRTRAAAAAKPTKEEAPKEPETDEGDEDEGDDEGDES